MPAVEMIQVRFVIRCNIMPFNVRKQSTCFFEEKNETTPLLPGTSTNSCVVQLGYM